MREALYAPEEGYYRRLGAHPAGRDFRTAPSQSRAFVALAGGKLRRWAEGLPQPWAVLEFGCGAAPLLEGFDPAGCEAVAFLMEGHRDAASEAAGRLRARGAWSAVECFEDLSAASSSNALAGARTLLWTANEFFDAFPVDVARFEGGGRWSRMQVALSAEGFFAETWSPWPEDDEEGLAFLRRFAEGHVKEAGFRVEVPRGWRAFFRAFSALAQGKEAVLGLVFDYGAPSALLYAPARRGGTLRAFWRGTLTTRVLARPGEQDLTASVNTEALRCVAAEEAGLESAEAELAAFLLEAGAGELMEPGALSEHEHRALLSWLDPATAGGAFRALVFARGTPLPKLSSFRGLLGL